MNIEKLTNATIAEIADRGYELRVWDEPSTLATHAAAYFPYYLGNFGEDVATLDRAIKTLKKLIRQHKKETSNTVLPRLSYEVVQLSTTAENLIRRVELRAKPSRDEWRPGLAKYAIQWNRGLSKEVCEPCGIEWAKANDLVEDCGQWDEAHASTDPNAKRLFVDAPWHEVETDAPRACETCGQWLYTYLLPGAWDYMDEHDFPEWIRELYRS